MARIRMWKDILCKQCKLSLAHRESGATIWVCTTTFVAYKLLSKGRRGGAGCDICGRRGGAKRRLHVDHDHKTMIIRGILCQGCNSAIATFDKPPWWLRAARKYLFKAESSKLILGRIFVWDVPCEDDGTELSLKELTLERRKIPIWRFAPNARPYS